MLQIAFVIQDIKKTKEISVVFHNGSKYNYRFIIKELTEEFEGQFDYLGENTDQYINFLEPIKKTTRAVKQ